MAAIAKPSLHVPRYLVRPATSQPIPRAIELRRAGDSRSTTVTDISLWWRHFGVVVSFRDAGFFAVLWAALVRSCRSSEATHLPTNDSSLFVRCRVKLEANHCEC